MSGQSEHLSCDSVGGSGPAALQARQGAGRTEPLPQLRSCRLLHPWWLLGSLCHASAGSQQHQPSRACARHISRGARGARREGGGAKAGVPSASLTPPSTSRQPSRSARQPRPGSRLPRPGRQPAHHRPPPHSPARPPGTQRAASASAGQQLPAAVQPGAAAKRGQDACCRRQAAEPCSQGQTTRQGAWHAERAAASAIASPRAKAPRVPTPAWRVHLLWVQRAGLQPACMHGTTCAKANPARTCLYQHKPPPPIWLADVVGVQAPTGPPRQTLSMQGSAATAARPAQLAAHQSRSRAAGTAVRLSRAGARPATARRLPKPLSTQAWRVRCQVARLVQHTLGPACHLRLSHPPGCRWGGLQGRAWRLRPLRSCGSAPSQLLQRRPLQDA